MALEDDFLPPVVALTGGTHDLAVLFQGFTVVTSFTLSFQLSPSTIWQPVFSWREDLVAIEIVFTSLWFSRLTSYWRCYDIR